MHDNPYGDDRYYNNLFVKRGDLTPFDKAPLPVKMDGNVFLGGAKPSKLETDPLVRPDFDPALKLAEAPDGFYLELALDPTWPARTRPLVTTALLGRAVIPDLPYERADETPIRITGDYLGRTRNEANPSPGPFENPGAGQIRLRVWPTEPSKRL